ncbi:hypothetical protein OC844_005430 [Tilletia horrida]|nr:hypothetical protein OC844_005430 [Tilletia horrida]
MPRARSSIAIERNARRRSVLAYRAPAIANLKLSDSTTATSGQGARRSALRTVPRLSEFRFEARRPSAESANSIVSSNGTRWRAVRFERGTKTADGNATDNSSEPGSSPDSLQFRMSRRLARLRCSIEHYNIKRRGYPRLTQRSSSMSASSRRPRDSTLRASITSLTSDLEEAFTKIATEVRSSFMNGTDRGSDDWAIRSIRSGDSPTSSDSASFKRNSFFRMPFRRPSASSSERSHNVLQPLAWSFAEGGPPTAKPLSLEPSPSSNGPVRISDIKRKIQDTPKEPDTPTPRTERLQSEPVVGLKAHAASLITRARSNSVGSAQFGSIAPRRGKSIAQIFAPSAMSMRLADKIMGPLSANRSKTEPKGLKPLLLVSKVHLSAAASERTSQTSRKSSFSSLRSASSHSSARDSGPKPVWEGSTRPVSKDKRSSWSPTKIETMARQGDENVDGPQECLATPSPYAESFAPSLWSRSRKPSRPNVGQQLPSTLPTSQTEPSTPTTPAVPIGVACPTERSPIDAQHTLQRSQSFTTDTSPRKRLSFLQSKSPDRPRTAEGKSPPPRPLELAADPFARTDGFAVESTGLQRQTSSSSLVSSVAVVTTPITAAGAPSTGWINYSLSSNGTTALQAAPSTPAWTTQFGQYSLPQPQQSVQQLTSSGTAVGDTLAPTAATPTTPSHTPFQRQYYLPAGLEGQRLYRQDSIASQSSAHYYPATPSPSLILSRKPSLARRPSAAAAAMMKLGPIRRISEATLNVLDKALAQTPVSTSSKEAQLLRYETVQERLTRQNSVPHLANQPGYGPPVLVEHGQPPVLPLPNLGLVQQRKPSAASVTTLAGPSRARAVIEPLPAWVEESLRRAFTELPPPVTPVTASAPDILHAHRVPSAPTLHQYQHRPSEPIIRTHIAPPASGLLPPRSFSLADVKAQPGPGQLLTRPTAATATAARTTRPVRPPRPPSLNLSPLPQNLRRPSTAPQPQQLPTPTAAAASGPHFLQQRSASVANVGTHKPLSTSHDTSLMLRSHSVAHAPSATSVRSLQVQVQGQGKGSVPPSPSWAQLHDPHQFNAFHRAQTAAWTPIPTLSTGTVPTSAPAWASHTFRPEQAHDHEDPRAEADASLALLTRKTRPKPPPPKILRAAGSLADGVRSKVAAATVGQNAGVIPKTREEREAEGMLSVAVAKELEGLAVGAGAGLGTVVYC